MTRSLEKRYRRKPHAARRRRDKDRQHWLQAGALGQESLLLDLDAQLYAIDSLLSRLVSSCAHSYDGNENRPFALFLPPAEQLGWQLHYIAKYYNVYLWADPTVDQLQEMVERFDAQLITGDLEPGLDRWIDLFITTEHNWISAEDFAGCMREVIPILSPEGTAASVLTAFGSEDALEVAWGDGSTTPLADLLANPPFGLPKPRVSGSCQLTTLDPRESQRMNDFLKRNRGFFGRDMRELLLARLGDSDVADWFSGGQTPNAWVLLLQWQSQTSY